MSEEKSAELKPCDLCKRQMDTVKTRCFRDPYSGQTEEFESCVECFEDLKSEVYSMHREDFGPREIL